MFIFIFFNNRYDKFWPHWLAFCLPETKRLSWVISQFCNFYLKHSLYFRKRDADWLKISKVLQLFWMLCSFSISLFELWGFEWVLVKLKISSYLLPFGLWSWSHWSTFQSYAAKDCFLAIDQAPTITLKVLIQRIIYYPIYVFSLLRHNTNSQFLQLVEEVYVHLSKINYFAFIKENPLFTIHTIVLCHCTIY